MGDAALGAEVNMMNMESSALGAFYTSWLELIADDQDQAAGYVHDLAPAVLAPAAAATPSSSGPGAPNWQAAFPTIVWAVHRYLGDVDVVQRHWASLQRYAAWLDGAYRAGGGAAHFLNGSQSIGDWCPPPQGNCSAASWCPAPGKHLGEFPCPDSYSNVSLTALASFMRDLHTLSELAAAVGDAEQAGRYDRRARELADDFNAAFLAPLPGEHAHYGNGWQTEQGFPLWLGIVPEVSRPAVLQQLVHNIVVENRGHTNSGILGTKFVAEVSLFTSPSHARGVCVCGRSRSRRRRGGGGGGRRLPRPLQGAARGPRAAGSFGVISGAAAAS